MVSFDVDSIKERMITRLKTKQSWKDMLFYNTNLILVETFAEELHYTADFDVYLTNECKWGLAKNRTSLLSSQDLHGYQAKRKISANGNLRVSTSKTFDSANSTDVYIPKYCVFKTDGNIKFFTTNYYILNSGIKYIDIDIKQGEFKTLTYTALGNANEVVNVSSSIIADSSIDVYVNDILFTQVNNSYDCVSTDKSYTLRQRIDNNTIDIVFGDGIYGVKLNAGDTVKINYVDTLGSAGNISGINNINKVVTAIKDVNGNSTKLYCTNVEAILGGKDEEPIESIRYNATNYFQTGDRAVSSEDYKTLILQLVSYIDKIVVWGVYEYNLDNNRDMWEYLPPEENVVNICALTSSLTELTQAQKDDISEKILNKKSPTDILRFQSPSIIDMIFTIEAFVKDKSYLLNEVKNSILNTLQDNYSAVNMGFFEHLYASDYTRLVDEVDGVYYHNINFYIQNYFTFRDAYSCIFNTALYTITKYTLEVYIRDLETLTLTLIGKDNGLGNIIGEAGYDLTGSAIGYTNGVGLLIVLSGLTKTIDKYQIFIKYKVENNNAILKARTQILNYNAVYSSVTTNYIQ